MSNTTWWALVSAALIVSGLALLAAYALRQRPKKPATRWRVQAFLLAEHTGTTEKPYGPMYYSTRRGAETGYRILADSFGPGMVRIDVTEEILPNDDHKH